MKVILKKISEQAIKLNDPFNKITEQQKELEWLGTSAAKMEEIEMAEKKLSVIYFLMTTRIF
jgi:hypothetical protein